MNAYSCGLSRRALLGGVAATMLASTAMRPVGTGAQGATPAAQSASGGIESMLALMPTLLPWLDDPAGAMIRFADIAAQLAATGVEPVDAVDDPDLLQWKLATHMLSMPGYAVEFLESWRDDYGFDLLQADQTLAVSQPPFDLSLFQGRFDPHAVRAALTNSGYQEVDVDGSTVYSLRGDLEPDAASPLAYTLAAMNHGAILDDGTLVFSSVRAAVEAVLDVAAGAAPAQMGVSRVALLVEHMPSDLVTAMIADGVVLIGDPPIPGVTEMPAGTMPPVTLVMAGATAGSAIPGDDSGLSPDTPAARAVAVAVLDTPQAAQAAVPVVEARLETGTSALDGSPWSRFVASSTVSAVAGEPVLTIDLTLRDATTPTILVDRLERGDLDLLAR